MARLDRVPRTERVLAALKAGDMTTGDLCRRLRVKSLHNELRALAAQGRIAQISPASGAEGSRWTLRRGPA